MAKKKIEKKKVIEVKEKETSFDIDKHLPEKYRVPAAIGIIFLLLILFLNPLFFGSKTFSSGDIIAFTAMRPFVEMERDGVSLWNPYIFCGMPSYALGVKYNWYNSIAAIFYASRDAVSSIFSSDYTRYALYLVLLGITMFFLMRYLTKNFLISMFTSLTTMFSTGLIVFLYIGHVTKLSSLAMYPLVFLILFQFQEKLGLLKWLLLIIALHILIVGFHVQIIFYTLFAVGIYYLYFLFRYLKRKEKQETRKLLKSVAAFIGAFIIAILINAPHLTQTYEYTAYSTRGTKGILENANPIDNEESSDYYEYHTNWSFSPGEVLTFFVPSYYGFGKSKYQGELTNNHEVEVNTYFGQMPFVDVAMYMGVLVFVLALFGIVVRWRDPIVRFLTILSGIALVISFGKTFPILFDLLFYYLPFFDKFRVPSMILVLVQLSIPILAGYGLYELIFNSKKFSDKIKNFKIAAIVTSVAAALILLLKSSIINWFTGRIDDYASTIEASNQQLAQQHRVLAEYTAGMFHTDLLLAFIFIAAAVWLVYLFLNKRISRDLLLIGLIVIALIDLFRIDARGATYQEQLNEETLFAEPNYVDVIKSQNNTEPFRFLNLKTDGSLGSVRQNSNYNVYFLIEDFYGYSGIKPRTFQDIMDVVGPANPTLWNMLNVKYLVFSQPNPVPGFKQIYSGQNEFIYENQNVLPRVYLVDSVATIDNLEFLQLTNSQGYDPDKVAFIHDGKINVDKQDSTSLAEITKYDNEVIEADVHSTGKGFLFIGNTYLPSGWKAFVDGNETKVYQTNHGFMGIEVPEGEHKVKIVYSPSSFGYSKYTALILSYSVLIGLVFLIAIRKKSKRQTKELEEGS